MPISEAVAQLASITVRRRGERVCRDACSQSRERGGAPASSEELLGLAEEAVSLIACSVDAEPRVSLPEPRSSRRRIEGAHRSVEHRDAIDRPKSIQPPAGFLRPLLR